MTEERVRAARIRATRTYPYLSVALMSVPLSKSDLIDTMCITKDGRIYWNEEFASKLTVQELEALLVHEIWHLLRLHAERGERLGLDSEGKRLKWNIAADCEINDSLHGLPKGAIYPNNFKLPDNRTAEEYYEKLPDPIEITPMVSAGRCGSGADGNTENDPEKGSILSKTDKELLIRSTAEAIRSRGDVPSELQRWADEILNPKVPWQQELRAAICSSAAHIMGKTDFTYRKRSRRSQCTRAVLPGMIGFKPKVGVVIDTSGSMSDKDIGACLSEINGIIKAVSDRVSVYVTDATVHRAEQIWDVRQIKLTGGGGTDLREGIKASVNDKNDITIVLTDGWTPWPERKCKLIVCLTDESRKEDVPPWAKTICL